ncbi:MAG: amino acid ABC transporter substrate-binding protein [Proteobacteria bacterium]|nr:amino acid ABC transporter substrate-binding protein [Pseudomonadota bacterium]
MIKRILTAVAAVAIGVGVVASSTFAQEKTVRIGFSLSQTGLFSQAAPSQMTVYELWRDEVNARGGLNVAGEQRMIEFVSYDDKSIPSDIDPIYERLITIDKVDLLLPPWGTPNHLALAGVAERHKFPVVGNTAASVAVREVNPGYIWFPTSLFPDRFAIEMTSMLLQLGVKSVAVIANVLAFPQENFQFLIPALEEGGIEVKVSENYPPDISDMTPVLTKIKNANVDGVIVLSFPADTFLYMGQSREIGLDNAFQFVLVGPSIAVFRQAFGDWADGIVTMGHWSPYGGQWEGALDFFNAYVERYDIEPDFLDSALTYVSLQILEQAVATAGLDREELRRTIASQTFQTINGPVRFSGIENVTLETGFLQIQNGQIHIVWPASMATSTFMPR